MFRGNSHQLFAVLAGTINAISDGMQYGWSSPAMKVLESPDSPVEITKDDEVWLELCYLIGGLFGLPLTIYLIDSVGRKYSVLLSSVAGVIGWICIGAGTDVTHLLIGRFILGMTADIAFNASPMYIAEIAHPNIRGFLAGIIYLMMLLGVVIIYCIGPIFPIYASSLIGCSLLVLQLIVFPFMPESPYFLIYVDKYEKAKKSLKALRNGKDVTDELNDIQKAVERQKTERGRPQDLILVKSNRKACLIMLLLNSTQHFVGITTMIMNMQQILDAAGATFIPAPVASIIFSCLMLFSATTATCIVDKCGRKVLLVLSGIMTSISLFVMAAYFHVQSLNYDLGMNWIIMVAVMVYAVVFKLGLGIVPIVMTAELFPARVKGMGMSVSDGVYVICSTISVYLYKYLESTSGIYVPFYLFACCAIGATTLIAFYIPETTGKTLDEIQMILKE